MPARKNEYDVGYGKPPKKSQFTKGKSGNPRGRPKNARNRKTVIRDVLEKPVKFREGERIKSASVFEVMLRRQAQNAAQGDPRSFLAMLKLAKEHGLLDEGTSHEYLLSPTEEALLTEIIDNLKKTER